VRLVDAFRPNVILVDTCRPPSDGEPIQVLSRAWRGLVDYAGIVKVLRIWTQHQ
jgi:hypothetical protein